MDVTSLNNNSAFLSIHLAQKKMSMLNFFLVKIAFQGGDYQSCPVLKFAEAL